MTGRTMECGQVASFELSAIPRIVSGPDRLSSIGIQTRDLIGEAGSVLLVADKGLRPFGQIEAARHHLQAAGHQVAIFDDITGEPEEVDVDAALALGRALDLAAVVCLGGGSALDAGKLVACLVRDDRPVSAFRLAAEPLPMRSVSLIAVPTTSGTGSEATATSVLKRSDKSKVWYWGTGLKPDLIILDPDLTLSLPAAITAATGIDAWVHAVEAATNRRATSANSLYALESIRLIHENLPRAIDQPQEIEVRANLQYAATLAGIAIDNCGTALAHAIGHGLGSLVPVPHGQAIAIAMAASLPFAISGNRSAFDSIANAMGVESSDHLIDAFVQFLSLTGLQLSIPDSASLTADGLAEKIAAPENQPMLRANARHVSDEELMDLAGLTLALMRGSHLRENI